MHSPHVDEFDLSILKMLYRGMDDAAIARRLRIGHRTVQRRVHRIMLRLNAKGRVALGARAQELGLLRTAEPVRLKTVRIPPGNVTKT
ncbi:LuxR C-terminal-related transcriptional regulator [Streptomyces sp. KL109B]|nr:helix-turn-helix transcriptional regulator [Streptomyces sp. KL109B]